jgi:hypothetical protein
MKRFRIEEMRGNCVVATHEVEALTPFQAAQEALAAPVTLRAGAENWVRVLDLSILEPTRLRPRSFEFRALGRGVSFESANVHTAQPTKSPRGFRPSDSKLES